VFCKGIRKEFMAIFKFNVKKLRLKLCDDENAIVINHNYSGFSIYLDKCVYEYLENCRLLISNNNFVLIIENENEKHWRISHALPGGDFWGCIVGGKLIIKEEEKIKILCTEADIKFKIPGIRE
jgi:hypothetical protein